MLLNAKKEYFSFLLLISATAFGQPNDFLDLGIGVGIQSYPSPLDPYEFVERYPILYPTIELRTQLINGINFDCSLSRTKTTSSLFGLIDAPQFLELITIALGLDYYLIDQPRTFSIGAQLLLGFGEYGYIDYSKPGLGFKLCALGTQPITRCFTWGIRTGIQRIRIQPASSIDPMNLDTFSVELLGYLSL